MSEPPRELGAGPGAPIGPLHEGAVRAGPVVGGGGVSDLLDGRLRLARGEEAPGIADPWLRSRRASFPANPAPVHDDDVRGHLSSVVLRDMEVWVIDGTEPGPVGFAALTPGWVQHLYVDPELTGPGLGSQLLTMAKRRHQGGLDLWTFQSNAGARRFSERHGFVVVTPTDGDNEEREPDVRYHWEPS